MLDILKFTFETYSHFWGMIFLIWFTTVGLRAVITGTAKAVAKGIEESK